MLFSLLLSAAAQAAPCDKLLAGVDKLAPEQVAGAYNDLLKCDREQAKAEATFFRYVARANTPESLAALSLAAINADIYAPVWQTPGKIPDYSLRDEVARQIGASCTQQAKVIPFLEGAYPAVRDIVFRQWDDAYLACESQDLWAWVEEQVKLPPDSTYNEKYNTLLDIYVKHTRAAALPTLTQAAIKAAATGPFDTLLAKMVESTQPGMGQPMKPEDKAALEKAMVEVARNVPLEKARAVAAQLADSGATDAAAQLLPTLYADRVQGGGGFLYGAIAVEECAASKTVVLHVVTVSEPGKLWNIAPALEKPLQGFKPKIKGCEVATPWAVVTSPEPVARSGDVSAWAATVQKAWVDKGYTVKIKSEKAISL